MSLFDLSLSLCCLQWGWPELQREPKQLLQPVLASVLPCGSIMFMHNLCGVTWNKKDHISADQDHLRLTPQINSGGLHFSYHYGFEWDWVSGLRNAYSDEPIGDNCFVFLMRLSALLQTWNELKLRNIWGGEKRGMWGELLREQMRWFRHLLQCHCNDPGSLEQPTGASPFHVELRGFRENLITSTVSLCESVCVCVWLSAWVFSFLRDCSSLLFNNLILCC